MHRDHPLRQDPTLSASTGGQALYCLSCSARLRVDELISCKSCGYLIPLEENDERQRSTFAHSAPTASAAKKGTGPKEHDVHTVRQPFTETAAPLFR